MLGAKVEVFRGAVWGGNANSVIRVPASTEAQDRVLSALLATPLEEKRWNPLEWLISLIIHFVVIAALVIAPLLFTQVIDLHNVQLTYLVLPAPPAAPAPAPPAAAVQKMVPRKPVPLNPAKLTAPSLVPRHIAAVHDEPAPDISGGVIGGIPGGISGGVLGGIIGGTGPAVSPVVPPVAVAPKPKEVLRVGGDVKPPHKLFAPPPRYPALAQSVRIQGVVVIDATIDEHGNVVNAKAVEGQPLLIPEALRTVMLWKYEPTYLNGVPYPVSMTVTVSFSFAAGS